jgi:hypothetical protein
MGQLKRKPDGLGQGKTYLGKVSVPAKPQRELGSTDGIDRVKVMTKLKIRELQFLDAYVKVGSMEGAMLSLYPKMARMTAHRHANRVMHSIDSKITPEEKFALMGITTGKLARVVSDAMDAKFQKEFVTRDGLIIAGREHEDHQIRMDAAKLGAKLLGIDKVDNNPAIAINIINYAPTGAAPWPTSGSTNPEIDITPGAEEI